MRVLALTSLLACSLAFATVPQDVIAAAPKSKSSKKKKKGKGSKDKGSSTGDDEASVPEPGAGDSERVGRVFVDTDALGDAGPFIAGRATRVVEGVFEAESVQKTDALAGPELRVVITERDSGGYQAKWEIIYNGEALDDGAGSFECQLCTEDELIEKIETLAKEAAPKMVVPEEPEEEPDPEIDIGVGNPPDDGTGGKTGGNTDQDPGKLGGMGKAGVALLVVGGLATISGVVLVAIPRSELEIANPGDQPELRSTREPGFGVLGAGVAALVVGGVLVGIDRKRAKKRASNASAVSVTPWFRADGGGLGVRGRF